MQLCWMFHVAPFAHPVARCWELLHSLAQHYNKDASTRNVVGATMLDVIVSVSKELNFVIYIEVIYDKKIVSLVVFRQLRLTVPEQTKETRLKIGMNFRLQETVPIYWFFTIFNQVKIKLNEAIFFISWNAANSLLTNEKRLEPNAPRSCFWDCYWGRPLRYWRICFPCPQ